MQLPLVIPLPFVVRGAAIALTGAAITFAALPRGEPRNITAPAAQPVPEVVPVDVHVQTTEREPAPPPVRLLGGDFAFVFGADGRTFVQLRELDAEELPAHTKPRFVKTGKNGATSLLASVRQRAVPAGYRAWLGREVSVDGTCTAHVTGVSIVWRLTGDPGYAGVDGEDWTVASVLAHGKPVLAAALDGCAGDHTYARDAALPAAVHLETIPAPAAEEHARTALLASRASQEAQVEWEQTWQRTGKWWNDPSVTVSTTALRHPKTGAIFVWATAEHSSDGCGDPPMHVRALFRQRTDGSLEAIDVVRGGVETIDQLLDVEGDGTLELIGQDWLEDDRVLERTDGTVVTQTSVPFYGCPC
jgi:hypothetical protein